MKSKGLRTCLSIVLGLIILAVVFVSGVGVGYFAPRLMDADTPEITSSDPSGSTPTEDEALFAPFWEAWDIVHQEYVDQPVNDLSLMRGAIEGMLNALGDPHTSYMSPEEYTQANESLEGEYEGIGAWVDTSGEYVEIISPMKGSPAAEAGLLPKDLIIAIDGEDMSGIPGDIALQSILGPAGSDVTLTIRRENETFDVTITRQQIIVPTVEHEMLEDDIASIALYTYGDKSTEQLRDALRDLLAQDPIGLIFDLRNNGGGYLTTAIEVVSEFIRDGVVMYEQEGDGVIRTYEAISGGLATEIPLVVLVNEGTASASEITAGAIQDRGRGPLVGAVTFGKGSVQNWIPLNDNAGAVRVTVARWLTPDQRQLSGDGLTPEYIVEMTEEDYTEGRDPQLEKAVQVLKSLVQ